MTNAKVIRWSTYGNGYAISKYNEVPFLNTIVYDVEFPDGQVKEYATNVITENMLSQVDSEGYSTTLMQGIVDWKRGEATAVPKTEKWVNASST